MEKETKFREDVTDVSTLIIRARTVVSLIENYISQRDRIAEIVFDLEALSDYLDEMHDFLIKYDKFFDVIDNKFGTNIKKSSKSSKRIIGDMKKKAHQILVFISQGQFKTSAEIWKNLVGDWESLLEDFVIVATLPAIVDYSKLSDSDWRMVGVAGVHFRSKIFLSYPFRDDDPKKDENQKMIDNYVKPTLALLNIVPLIARDYLKSQQLIDDRIGELIKDCDGIIGFYTSGDSVENVEHELSKNPNVIAICREEGARAPSMRLSRLLINFKRERMGDFLIQLIEALRDKSLFRLVV